MNISIKKPILFAGISISFLLWILQIFKNSVGEIGDLNVLIITIMAGFWLLIKRKKSQNLINLPQKLFITSQDFQKKISTIKIMISNLITEAEESDYKKEFNINYNNFEERLTIIENNSKKDYLDIVILSSNKVSPSSLKDILKINFSDLKFNIKIETFNILENVDINLEILSLQSDLILFMIHGDITESEKNIIQKITNNNQQILVLFNDIDYNLAEEKAIIFENIKTKVKDIIQSKYLIKISTKTQIIKVKKYDDEINYREWEETTQGDYKLLTNIFKDIVDDEKEKLILFTAYRNILNLQKDIQEKFNLIRKQKALPLIEKYQIIAATATFANPVSSLDLLATAAINTQMIIDLSGIYQQSLSLNQAQEISIALGKLMVKLGIVEISSQAITAILKSNLITYVAGGAIQGISAAYLTRICGLSLIEYYEVIDFNNNEGINLTKIKEKLQLIFQKNKDNNFLTKFVQKTALQFQNI
ncbi:hypothetical protein GM3708_2239 [Geminocystis sp. NIES-3708]|uniref:YcjF family protein n=1 Tax=Geminocystis sp. NIES-3708 TaxID=1615909 RepID=UPI0005FCA5DE|nr:YcjF family protein [Geminocystis sp. NIES-3708]BAQ61833.1 hypothetical protein GM3708_2239 [Geminocystis sp. NIES-3708]